MTNREKYPSYDYPFSDDLCRFMDAHRDFHDSLKLNNPRRFDFLRILFTSYTPQRNPRHNEQVIGLWYLDRTDKACGYGGHKGVCRFKQDFIVNVASQGKEFISYWYGNGKGDFIKPIREFFQVYGDKGRYFHDGKEWQHHYRSIQELPDEPLLRDLANKAVQHATIKQVT